MGSEASRFNRISDTPASLGEGLHLDEANGAVFWVDIDRDELFRWDGKRVQCHPLPCKPSVVLASDVAGVLLGCDLGIARYELATRTLSLLTAFPETFDRSRFRSNDGVRLAADCYLLGTMSRDDPADSPGTLYLFTGSASRDLAWPVSIPNSFIVLGEVVLVSDSASGVVYALDASGLRESSPAVRASIWVRFPAPEEACPDGGCFDGSDVYLAVWGGGEILRYTTSGILQDRIAVPVVQPSNCRCCAASGRLWVTSARQGLAPEGAGNDGWDGHTFWLDP